MHYYICRRPVAMEIFLLSFYLEHIYMVKEEKQKHNGKIQQD